MMQENLYCGGVSLVQLMTQASQATMWEAFNRHPLVSVIIPVLFFAQQKERIMRFHFLFQPFSIVFIQQINGDHVGIEECFEIK